MTPQSSLHRDVFGVSQVFNIQIMNMEGRAGWREEGKKERMEGGNIRREKNKNILKTNKN